MSIEQRRWDMQQAIANARIEGFEPDAEFLALMDRLVRDEITHDEAAAIILERARAEDRRATERRAATGATST